MTTAEALLEVASAIRYGSLAIALGIVFAFMLFND